MITMADLSPDQRAVLRDEVLEEIATSMEEIRRAEREEEGYDPDWILGIHTARYLGTFYTVDHLADYVREQKTTVGDTPLIRRAFRNDRLNLYQDPEEAIRRIELAFWSDDVSRLGLGLGLEPIRGIIAEVGPTTMQPVTYHVRKADDE